MWERSKDRIVTALYEGVVQKPYWSTFTGVLREVTRSDYVSLVFRRLDARVGEVNVMNSGGSSARLLDAKLREVLRGTHLPYDDLVPNRPYRLAELLDADNSDHRAYRTYLNQRSFADTIVVRVTEPDVGNAWLTLGRTGPKFGPEAAEVLRWLAPHLLIAARMLAAIEWEKARADMVSDAVHRLHFGWLTFDEQGRVVTIDAEVERLFRAVPELRGTVIGRRLPLNEAVRTAFGNILDSFAGQSDASPRAIHLADDPWLDMLVAPVVYRPVSCGITPVAVGYLRGAEGDNMQRCDQLKQLFSLTKSEARLALAMTEGKSIAEAAHELDLAVETARNYSKRIYAKTGTKGQADLVRTILASVLALT